MKALIGTDGSDEALAAATAAAGILATATSVVIVCVVEAAGGATDDIGSGFGTGVEQDASELERGWAREHEAAGAAIDRTAAAVTGADSVERVIEHGDAGEALCRLAADRAADVVVVGSRGHGRFRRALLGSVSTHVVNNAPCPVLVVRRGTGSPAP
jgi:nucleotide-binding universal stress UspA family protein